MQGMQSTPTHMDRYQQGLGGSWSHRAQGGQQRRQWHNNDQYGDMRRQNFQGNQQRRQWSNYGSGNEDIMRLPPSEMMTSKEKEWLVKIQLMTLMTDDPKNTDYYYMVSGFYCAGLLLLYSFNAKQCPALFEHQSVNLLQVNQILMYFNAVPS